MGCSRCENSIEGCAVCNKDGTACVGWDGDVQVVRNEYNYNGNTDCFPSNTIPSIDIGWYLFDKAGLSKFSCEELSIGFWMKKGGVFRVFGDGEDKEHHNSESGYKISTAFNTTSGADNYI